MKNIKCERCGTIIDRSACGQAFTIITIKDDRANNPEKTQQKRFYLCDDCTASLEVTMAQWGLERLER